MLCQKLIILRLELVLKAKKINFAMQNSGIYKNSAILEAVIVLNPLFG